MLDLYVASAWTSSSSAFDVSGKGGCFEGITETVSAPILNAVTDDSRDRVFQASISCAGYSSLLDETATSFNE